MEKEKEMMYKYLRDIKECIDEHEQADGSYSFDVKRVLVALDFTKSELEKSVQDSQ